MRAGENNAWQESVEEKYHSSTMGILSHHTPFDIANSYSIDTKHWNTILKINNSKLTSGSLMIEAGHLPQMVGQSAHHVQPVTYATTGELWYFVEFYYINDL